MAGEYNERKRNSGWESSAGGNKPTASWPSRELPDELVVEILSRLGTLNEAARCSSLVCRRWRNMWRLIGGGILDFDSFDDDVLPRHDEARWWGTEDEERRRFADRVDQALSCLVHHENLDALKIGSDFLEMDGVGRWLEFGLTKRVKQVTLLCYFSSCYFLGAGQLCLKFFTPEFLAKHDLGRLESLELFGLCSISQAAVDHILSNCPSLRLLALRSCIFLQGEDTVLRLGSSNNITIECLDFDHLSNVARIELVSAPCLRTCRLRGYSLSQVEFGDGTIPRLQDALFTCSKCLFPWSRDQFRKFAPRLRCLTIEVIGSDLLPNPAPRPEWLLFEKLRVLNLFLHTKRAPLSFLDCTVLLRAAPVLHKLSIWFGHYLDPEPIGTWNHCSPTVLELHRVDPCYGGVDDDDVCKIDADRSWTTTWKHHSLKVLELHGVHPWNGSVGNDVCKRQLDLAANIIMNTPSLSQVLIDTRRRGWLDGFQFSWPNQTLPSSN